MLFVPIPRSPFFSYHSLGQAIFFLALHSTANTSPPKKNCLPWRIIMTQGNCHLPTLCKTPYPPLYTLFIYCHFPPRLHSSLRGVLPRGFYCFFPIAPALCPFLLSFIFFHFSFFFRIDKIPPKCKNTP